MSFSADFALTVISAGLSVILTGILGVIAYYARGIRDEISKNTAARKWLLGDEELDEDEGFREETRNRLNDIEESMHEDHARVEQWMAFLNERLSIIANALESNDIEIRDPSNDSPGFFRGDGGSGKENERK